MRYDDYQRLVAPARPSASLKRLAVGAVLTLLFSILLGNLLWSVLGGVLPPEVIDALVADLDIARTPFAVLFNLFLFGLLIAALALTLRLIHARSLRGLIGPLPLAIQQFHRVAVALFVLLAITVFLPLPVEFAPTAHLPLGQWLVFLPLTLLGLLIQTSAEELVFRGYLQSQLAARFAHPVIWIGVPTVIFALLHHDPLLPDQNAWIVVIWAGCFGLAAADLTARSGPLGPAIALHMINNLSAVLIAAPQGRFDGLALYTYPFSLASSDALLAWAPVDLMILLCSWLAARLALRR